MSVPFLLKTDVSVVGNSEYRDSPFIMLHVMQEVYVP